MSKGGLKLDRDMVSVLMGEAVIAAAPVRMRTILGSCVGIALWDRSSTIGGIAHVVLPDSRGQSQLPGKFADTAVPFLLGLIVKAGGRKSSVTARIAGGANMFKIVSSTNVGEMNQEAVKRILREHGIPVHFEDLGGEKGRRMTLDTNTGEVVIETPGDRISKGFEAANEGR
ncbi:MAG: chemotaxis protein CheD [Planctomycetota bacterium]